jgi:hypothetical protein
MILTDYSEIMKDLFRVSIKGVQDLIVRQVMAIEEEKRGGKPCHISVCLAPHYWV